MGTGSKQGREGPPVQPLDLPALRHWLGTLASSAADGPRGGRRRDSHFWKLDRPAKSHDNPVEVLKAEFSSSLGTVPTEATLRRALALGVVQYVRRVGRVPADDKVEDVLLDVAAYALWSVAQAPDLPANWEGILARLTSPRMANLVAQARMEDATQIPDNFAIFYRILATSPATRGMRNLMEDLSDPKRGGAALAALALAAGLPEPDHRNRNRAALMWLFTALASGAVGAEGGHLANVGDRLAEDAWKWLTSELHPHGHSSSHGDVLADELAHMFFHH